jgi:type I restriction enzyme S subunit
MKETKFKDTEIGKIPEEWKMYSIGKDCSVKARIGWQGLTTSEYLQTGHYGLITSTDLIEGKVNWDTCVFVSEERYKQDTNIIVKNGDVLVSKDGTIGKVAVVSNLQYPTTLNSGVFVIRTKNEKITQEGLGLVFISPYFKDFIKRLTAGSTIVHLYQKDIVNFTFPIPTLPEQHHIASALTSIDNLITSLGKLIEKKKNIKQGAMQQLLTGKIRLKEFTEPWVYRKISEIATTSSGGTPSRSIPNYYYGDIKWFTTTELKDNYLYDSVEHITREALNNSSAKMFSANTILMAMYGATIGKLGVLKEPSTTNQACCAIKCNDIVEIFLFYILLYNRKSIIEKGCGAGQPNISQAIVNELSFLVPPCEKEQQAIANILSKMDNEITALEAKRAKYEVIKQGMMQQLLTGKIRLIS